MRPNGRFPSASSAPPPTDSFYQASEETRRPRATDGALRGRERTDSVSTGLERSPTPQLPMCRRRREGSIVPGPERGPDLFARTDAAVRFTAQAGLQCCRWSYRTPAGPRRPKPRRTSTTAMPADPQTFVDYLSALIGRYGPAATSGRQNPTLPKDAHQGMAGLERSRRARQPREPARPESIIPGLKAAYKAIHKADPRAKVVLTGLHNQSWTTLAQLYRGGIKGYSDKIALHPYTRAWPGTRNRTAQPSRSEAKR